MNKPEFVMYVPVANMPPPQARKELEELRQRLDGRYGEGLFVVIPGERYEVRRIDQPPPPSIPAEPPPWVHQLFGGLQGLAEAVECLADRLDRPTSSPTAPQS